MARKLRVQYPGAIYHVMNRGAHLEVIFRDGEDPQLFLRTLDEGCTRADWQVHCFCLMCNFWARSKRRLASSSSWTMNVFWSPTSRKGDWVRTKQTCLVPSWHEAA